jgi:hypothetical protein
MGTLCYGDNDVVANLTTTFPCLVELRCVRKSTENYVWN